MNEHKKECLMKNDVFGEVIFNYGWKTKTEITLWGEIFTIKVVADAYYEHEKITEEQEQLYLAFKKIPAGKIEALLAQFYEGAPNEFLTPTTLCITREGECALLFDDDNDPDNGMVAKLFPEEEVMTQDEFL